MERIASWDTAIFLYGIVIRDKEFNHKDHQFWIKENEQNQPKIILNQFKSTFKIEMINNKLYNIDVCNIDKIYIPQQPSLYGKGDIFEKKIGQYLNVIFIQCNNKQISIILDAFEFEQFSLIILNKNFKCNLINRYDIINDMIKNEFIDHTILDILPSSIYIKWEEINKINTFNGSNYYHEYQYEIYDENNNNFIRYPHHKNSSLYLKKDDNKKIFNDTDILCIWYCPFQHNHYHHLETITEKEYCIVKNDRHWLNDTLINFATKYIYTSWPAKFKKKSLMFNSYFYCSKLIKLLLKENKKIPTESEIIDIQRQTKNYNDYIFNIDKEYILIPCHENNHWFLVIIWKHNVIFNNYLSSRNNDNEYCYILILDSLNKEKSFHKKTFSFFKRWLNVIKIEQTQNLRLFNKENTKTKLINVPKQPDLNNCGCFLLRSLFQFGRDQGFNNFDKSNWYSINDGLNFRNYLKLIIEKLIDEQRNEYALS